MRLIFTLFGAGLALAACAPLTLYHRPGASVARMQTDQLNCEVRALKDAPVASEIRQRPPVFFPGRQICNGLDCFYRPGYWLDGGIYTVDVNQDLRGRVQDRCMAQSGYQPVTVALCNAAVKSAVTPGQTRTLPTLTPTACSIRYDDGSWQIVNPVNPGQAG